MPDIKIPSIDLEKAAGDLNHVMKEAAYVAVGLGVLGFQKAQVQRVELTKQIETQLSQLSSLSSTLSAQAEAYLAAVRAQLDEARGQVAKLAGERPDASAVKGQLADLAKAVDGAVAPARQQFDLQLDKIEGALPGTARNLVHTVREAATTQEKNLRSVVGLA